MSWSVNDLNCNILNSCINSQNVTSDVDKIVGKMTDDWSGIIDQYNKGGCTAVQNFIGLPQSKCQNGQGYYFSGCPEGPSYGPRGSVPVPICVLPGTTCPFNPECISSESYVNAPWTRPDYYVTLNQTWRVQKPFQL